MPTRHVARHPPAAEPTSEPGAEPPPRRGAAGLARLRPAAAAGGLAVAALAGAAAAVAWGREGAAAEPPDEATLAIRLGVAVLVGAAVGVEREWSGQTLRTPRRPRVPAAARSAGFAGVRTFLLLGALGGGAGLLLALGLGLAGAVVLAAGGALVVAGYAAIRHRPHADVGGTTEAAALLVLTLGALAGLGHLTLAAGTGALTTLALREKARLHWLVRRIGEQELRGALQFAVLALVVLPLLPAGPVAALAGVRPRTLWAVVLLFCAVNFAGFVARRVVGAARGYGITGLLGGIVSSTAVTLHFARQSRLEPALGPSLAYGVLGACTVVLPRVALISLVLNAAVARALAPLLLIPAAVGLVLLLLAMRRQEAPAASASSAERESPLRLWLAVQMAVAFQLAIWLIAYAQAAFGDTGVLASAVALGVTSTDALTVSMSRLGAEPGQAALAARAIAVGVLATTVVKLALALLLGGPGFRRTAAMGLGALAAATVAAIVVAGWPLGA